MASAYLLGYLRDGVIQDVIITSEFPVTTLRRKAHLLQVKLRESYGRDYDEAYHQLLFDIANDRTVSWEWLNTMRGFVAQTTQSPRPRDVVGVSRGPAPTQLPSMREIDVPREWIEREVSLRVVQSFASQYPPHFPIHEFLRSVVNGDRIWEFRSPPRSWQALAGRKGYVLERGGILIAQVTTMVN